MADRYSGTNLKISVVGAGKLGAPMGAALAFKGFEVTICDLDPTKVQAINEGRAPVDETGLQDLLFANRERLRATLDIAEAVRNSDITFVVTATPSKPDGRFSLEYILPVCEEIGRTLRKDKAGFHVVVITSTVMPGDTWGPIRETLELHSGRKCGESFGLCYNPEFIALGSVIEDFLHPDFVLLGASDPLSEARVSSIYEEIVDFRRIASISIQNAEITKLAVNSYITTKISFANMLSRVCNNVAGANVDVVTQTMGLDSRIGGKYLKGGVSFGGPCFPRDNRALATLGQSFPLTIDAFNMAQILWLADVVEKNAKGPIYIVGSAYKVGTRLTEESAGLALWNELTARKKNNVALDILSFSSSAVPETYVVMLPDPQWKDCNFSGATVIDPWRFLPELANDPTVKYIPLGIGPCVD